MSNLSVLEEIMGDLLGHHRQLLHLGQQKKEVLIAGDIQRLSALIEDESRIIRSISRLENERQQTVAHLLVEWNIQADHVTMSQLLDYVQDESQKDMLRTVQGELMGVMSELRRLNQLNKELIEQSLEFINNSLDIYTDIYRDAGTYDKSFIRPNTESSSPAAKNSRSMFDWRA